MALGFVMCLYLSNFEDLYLVLCCLLYDTNKSVEARSLDSEQRRLFTIQPPLENALSHCTDVGLMQR